MQLYTQIDKFILDVQLFDNTYVFYEITSAIIQKCNLTCN